MISDLKHNSQGFTLIELSVVIIIIGLIAGGVLVGEDLIESAKILSQISQINKYNAAALTFQSKYEYLPGDIPDPYASNFGFLKRGGLQGQGDGNGLIEGFLPSTTPGADFPLGYASSGEPFAFWEDLGMAKLIDGPFNNHIPTSSTIVWTSSTGRPINTYYPDAKLGGGNSVYVFSAGNYNGNLDTDPNGEPWQPSGINYFGLGKISSFDWIYSMSPAISVQEAYVIDTKIDDGMPQSGQVLAIYVPGYSSYNGNTVSFNAAWSTFNATTQATMSPTGWIPTNDAIAGSTKTCFDNDNIAGQPQHYSMKINSGNGLNCALAFQFK